MGTQQKFMSACVAAAMIMVGGTAFGAPQTGDQQKCLNTLNKDTCKVAATQGKENSACVKAGNKATAPAGCLALDGKGKVAKTKSKTTADETKNDCLGANAPGFGYSSGAIGNAAAQSAEIDLYNDTYGTTVLPGPISTAKLEGGCQATVTKDLEKIAATKWKEFVSCKKAALKAGGAAKAALENCVTPGGIAADAKGKIAKTLSKLGADIASKCLGVNVATTFPGVCSGSTLGGLPACLDARAECRVCQALNTTDNLTVNCDLFDDGLANGSCPSPLGSQTCTADAGSQLTLLASLPLPPLPVTSGGIAITCGTPALDGTAACACSVNPPGFSPLNIAGIFWACVKPAISGTCPSGKVDCDGGANLGLTMTGKRNIGGLCASNAACTTSCATQCGGIANVFSGTGQCEGFCTLGAQAACLTDAACLGLGQGSCNGPDGVGLGNICDCTCVNTQAAPPSGAGDLSCQMAFNLTVEPNPGNGSACDGADVSITVGDTCAPLTTTAVSAIENNANNGGTSFGPFNATGTTGSCAAFQGGSTAAISLVGSTQFYASTIGDILTGLKLNCL